MTDPVTAQRLTQQHKYAVWLAANNEIWFYHPMINDWVTLVCVASSDTNESVKGFIAQPLLEQTGPFLQLCCADFNSEITE